MSSRRLLLLLPLLAFVALAGLFFYRLGGGIYFGDAACTSSYYTTPGKKGTRFMSLARVALGKMKDYTKITYGITEPPPGYDSCHGVRAKAGVQSQFADDEYVIYKQQQQRLEYLVEFAA